MKKAKEPETEYLIEKKKWREEVSGCHLWNDAHVCSMKATSNWAGTCPTQHLSSGPDSSNDLSLGNSSNILGLPFGFLFL